MLVAAIVPAAGEGSRLREPNLPKKQFRSLGGRTVLERVLEALARHDAVEQIVIAAPPARVEVLAEELGALALPAAIEVVAGGGTRHESVGRALARVSPAADLVAVHDSVRPFVATRELESVFSAARAHGAAALAIPVGDTLRRAEGTYFGGTVDRDGLWRMQTPQVFRKDVLRKAHAAARGNEATDDVELVLQAGFEVHLVEGSSFNFKITTPADWRLALMLWPPWEAIIEGE